MKEDFHFFLTGRDDVINDTLNNDEGEIIPFTIGQYAEINKLARIRLYFCSKAKSVFEQIQNRTQSKSTFSDDENDFEPSSHLRQGRSMVVISDNDDEFGNFLDSQDPVTYSTSTPNGSLIGSSANRDRQPDESIELGNQREADSTKEERLKNLMEERRDLVQKRMTK